MEWIAHLAGEWIDKHPPIPLGTSPTRQSLLSLLPPSSGVFPTVPPTRVGLRPGSGIPTLADLTPSAVGLVGVGLLAMLRYPGMANW